MMGFRGADVSENSQVLRDIKEENPGGVILFDRDMVHKKPVHNIQSPEQLQALTKKLQEAADLPLLIGIDQEGGIIERLKPEYGFPETKSHQHLGERDDLDYTQEQSELIASVLSDAGINLNFAPVVDLAIQPKSSIIAGRERSFGRDAAKVTKHAEAYIHGHRSHRILTCCKHFPGHGSALGDTHAGFVDVSDTWLEEELEPYRALINKDLCQMIMTAHIFNSNWDADNPSTLSEFVLTKMLRDDLGFNGVVISDDMQMRAISDHYSLKDSLKLGLNAGIDMFCFGNNLLPEPVLLSDAIDAVEELISDGEIPLSRIDESVARILELKGNL
ncbi:MAG: glycoside hydrolase family 3 protein [Balneolaceae bacterium]|nr:glycoside hydrolase family 3 protein [Balneolaceae bacterium]